jgi:hypothetical protein
MSGDESPAADRMSTHLGYLVRARKQCASVRHPTNGSRTLGSAVATGSYADEADIRCRSSVPARSLGKTDVVGGMRPHGSLWFRRYARYWLFSLCEPNLNPAFSVNSRGTLPRLNVKATQAAEGLKRRP